MFDEIKRELWRYTVCNRSVPAIAIERLIQRRALQRWKATERSDPPPAAYKQELIREHAALFDLPTLIETGTYLGDTTDALLDHFEKVVTIELDARLARDAQRRFRRRQRVTVLHGDSGALLPELVRTLTRPALFWLDAHYSGGVTAHGPDNSPLTRELQSILASPLPHVVLIDDARLLGVLDGYPPPECLAKLAEVHSRQFSIDHDIGRLLPRPS